LARRRYGISDGPFSATSASRVVFLDIADS
jgi:hypothetical protein